MHYIAFLRGINVGGHRIIKMEDLKEMFSMMDLEDVRTYIQSGNVLFSSSKRSAEKLSTFIAGALEKRLGYSVGVLCLKEKELTEAIDACPFDEAEKPVKRMVYLSFLDKVPQPGNIKELMEFANQQEEYNLQGKVLYSRCIKDGSKLNFSNNFIERKLDVLATTRNWNSVNKILEMF